MPSDAFTALVGRYIAAFGAPPLNPVYLDDDGLAALMREALEKGRPIPEDDYERGIPDGADA